MTPMADSLHQFLMDVAAEVTRARHLFPSNQDQLAAFSEEAGEVAKAFIDYRNDDETAEGLMIECIQAAAMAARLALEGDASFPYQPRHADMEEKD